ncbi:hypothetical protein [Prevotellamassilia timonensis]|uniref:hypothetical protein n=1 Tax=Prevotellamassilia timonensis TaxID=1852370 RepID=UPI003077601A
MISFIKDYLSHGFGTMTKNDFEVYIFHWLINNHKDYKDKSDYEVSVNLRIPISKVKRLRYEANLKYPTLNDDTAKKSITDLLKKCKYRDTKEGGISFVINDKLLREYLQNYLNRQGRFFDSSFNSNIVSIATADFRFILDNFLLNDDDKKSILKDAKASLSEKSTLPQTFSEALKNMGAELCKSFAKKMIGENVTDAAFTLADYVKGVVVDYYQEAKN